MAESSALLAADEEGGEADWETPRSNLTSTRGAFALGLLFIACVGAAALMVAAPSAASSASVVAIADPHCSVDTCDPDWINGDAMGMSGPGDWIRAPGFWNDLFSKFIAHRPGDPELSSSRMSMCGGASNFVRKAGASFFEQGPIYSGAACCLHAMNPELFTKMQSVCCSHPLSDSCHYGRTSQGQSCLDAMEHICSFGEVTEQPAVTSAPTEPPTEPPTPSPPTPAPTPADWHGEDGMELSNPIFDF